MAPHSVKTHYKQVYVKKIATYSIPGPQVTKKNANLANSSPRGHMLSYSDLNVSTPSMATRKLLKHDSFENPVGGCSSCDVIAPWPDLTRSFLPKVAQWVPHNMCKISARSSQRFCRHSRKTHPHPPWARVTSETFPVQRRSP